MSGALKKPLAGYLNGLPAGIAGHMGGRGVADPESKGSLGSLERPGLQRGKQKLPYAVWHTGNVITAFKIKIING